MKKLLVLVLCVLLSITMCSCGENSEPSSTETPEQSQSDDATQNTQDKSSNSDNANSNMDEDKAFEILEKNLGTLLTDDTEIVSLGNESVNGENYLKFAFGKNTSEKFTAEVHLAVGEDGSVYIFDVIKSEYIPFDLAYFKNSSEGVNNAESESSSVWISFPTQEYIDDNIAEIPYFNYDGSRNQTIDSMNNSLAQGIGKIYDDFINSDHGHSWIEIKSYPFTSDDYIQVVVTNVVYPNYGNDGDLFTINYDKNTNMFVPTNVALDQLGMTEDQLLNMVGELFQPDSPDIAIQDVKLAGFLYTEGPSTTLIELLLEITVINPDDDTWKSFYSYLPEYDELIKLTNTECLFDPHDMDQMDPPLNYQKQENNKVSYAYSPYAYDTGIINDEQLSIYQEIYPKILAKETFSYTAEDDGYNTLDNLLTAWLALSTDYPEIDNYFFVEEKDDEEGNVISLDSNYSCIWEEDLNQDPIKLEEGLEKFYDICGEIIAGIPKDVDAYDKYYYLAVELSQRVNYDYSFQMPANYTPYCIVTGNGICSGYAKAYQYLCMKANLWCRVVSGSSEGCSHAWNIVKTEDGIFHVDVTWADNQGETGSEGWMKYFMLTEDQILKDHELLDY